RAAWVAEKDHIAGTRVILPFVPHGLCARPPHDERAAVYVQRQRILLALLTIRRENVPALKLLAAFALEADFVEGLHDDFIEELFIHLCELLRFTGSGSAIH